MYLAPHFFSSIINECLDLRTSEMSIDMGRRIVALGALSSCHFFSLSVSGCMGLAPQPEVQVFAFLPQDEGKDGVVLSAFHTRSKFAYFAFYCTKFDLK